LCEGTNRIILSQNMPNLGPCEHGNESRCSTKRGQDALQFTEKDLWSLVSYLIPS
jgi:hypothetical protein